VNTNQMRYPWTGRTVQRKRERKKRNEQKILKIKKRALLGGGKGRTKKLGERNWKKRSSDRFFQH